ncbi:MAG: thiamine pyrophosphate-binding protein [Alphaproteobacteria bacterium]|nr:MAG: thiamine pyrophosphate-binding protein [Alphaproteobacteria bacterium]
MLRRDVPITGALPPGVWGSDAIAALLRELRLPYVCVNPGASFRGLHDSIVNYLGNERPQMLLCLHEEHAVAIAHGYAKVTGRPLGAIVHSNVGLMHASMAIFDAWCDRVPVIVIGATGPVDADKRRPWIDWLHTAHDQAALVRHFVKWDAQPASVAAAFEAMVRAKQIAETAPRGPVYVCFDAALQEAKIEACPALPDVGRFAPPASPQPAPALVDQAGQWLATAARPLILMGRVCRDVTAWNDRVALAERLGAAVLTDLKVGAAFPTDHSLHVTPPGFFLSPAAAEALRQADVVLSLDWLDLGGTLKQAWGREAVASKIVQVSLDQYNHTGWGMEHQGLPPTDLYLLGEPDDVVRQLLDRVPAGRAVALSRRAPREIAPAQDVQGTISIAMLADALRAAVGDDEVCLIRLPLGWSGELWHFHHPLDYLGYDGGGGIGSGPGMAIGAAIALHGSGRMPIAVLGDGDYLMGVNALWTAANARVPLLVVACNNRSFFNDEVHQERVAKERGRPLENRWIGQRIADPEPDLAMLARAQGLVGIGPVKQATLLAGVLAQALAALKGGATVVVDVHVSPGYAASMAGGTTRSQGEPAAR